MADKDPKSQGAGRQQGKEKPTRKRDSSASKSKVKESGTVDEILQQLDYLTKSYESTAKSKSSTQSQRKQYKKHVFHYGSVDANTGRRKVHCPRKIVTGGLRKSQDGCRSQDNDSLYCEASDQPDSADTEMFSFDNTESDDDENDLYDVLQSCDPLIDAIESTTAKAKKKRTWYQRAQSSQTRWENVRGEVLNTSILSQQIPDNSLCSVCNENCGVIVCKQCRKYQYLCCFCDDKIHSSHPLHDRLVYAENQLQNLAPCQGITDGMKIIDITRFPELMLPTHCDNCCSRGKWERTRNNQECIVVTTLGRFDLCKFTIECLQCGYTKDPFKDISIIIGSHFWPGTVDTVTYLFDEDLFQCWDHYHLWMPGSSENGFIESLQDLSLANGRVGIIQREAFSNSFKEYKYLQYELNTIRKIDMFTCPSCHVNQHAAIFDGNMKTYRYKSAGRRMRQSYYGENFICDNSHVNDLVNDVYKGSRSKYKDDDGSLCGSSQWQAARNTFVGGGKRDETGLEVVSCRHCLAQKAVNMFRGEIFGYAYYLQKNYHSNSKFYFSDVACRYWKWLSKVDYELSLQQIPAIGMFHVKGHPPACEVLYGGMWKEGSGYTIGEEDEQIFSYLSRTGVTTKHMKPEYREESITEFAMFWNRRKILNLAKSLQKRLMMVKTKLHSLKEEFNRKTTGLSPCVTQKTIAEWKKSAITHAQVSQNALMSLEISPIEEYMLLIMTLKDLQKLPEEGHYVLNIQSLTQLSLKSLDLKILSKPVETLLERFISLNRKLLAKNTSCGIVSGFEDEALKLRQKILCAQQQKIEALFYSNLHISNNIGRLTDTCKKRRQLRLKVARQKEKLRKLAQDYNDNITGSNDKEMRAYPVVDVSSINQGNFPWVIQQTSSVGVNSQLKQAVLVIAISINRLQEEKVIIAEEMKSYLKFYMDINVPALQKDIQTLQESESECLCRKTTTEEVLKLCSSCEVSRGKRSLLLQGISYCVEQVRRGQRWFIGSLNDERPKNLCEDTTDFLKNDIDSPELDDGEDSDDEADDLEEYQDENTVAVLEQLSDLNFELPRLEMYQQEGVYLALFPAEVAQSTFRGRNGSNACIFINLLFANTFKQLAYKIDDTSELSSKMIALIYSSIASGNRIYDEYNDAGENFALPNVEEVCDHLSREDVVPVIEDIFDIFPASESAENTLERAVEGARNEARYINCLYIVEGRSSIFSIDPNGGIFFFDSHQHNSEGTLVCWTKIKSVQEMRTLMANYFQNVNALGNIAIVSFY